MKRIIYTLLSAIIVIGMFICYRTNNRTNNSVLKQKTDSLILKKDPVQNNNSRWVQGNLHYSHASHNSHHSHTSHYSSKF